jgi:MraZ protein
MAVLFTDSYDCRLDGKGRMMVPVKLQRGLAPVAKEGFKLKQSIFNKCLELYPYKVWEEEVNNIDKQLNRFNNKNRDFMRAYFDGATDVEIDNSGRILIPKSLLDYASITKEVMVNGMIDRLEIWDKEKYRKHLESCKDEEMKKLTEEVMGGTQKKEG